MIKNYLNCWNIIPIYNSEKLDNVLNKIFGNINMLFCFRKYINKNYVINLGYTNNFKWLTLNLTAKSKYYELYATVPAKWNNDYTIKRLVKAGSTFDFAMFMSSETRYNTIRDIVSELDASKEHGCSNVKVTDDVRYLETNCWDAIRDLDFCVIE